MTVEELREARRFLLTVLVLVLISVGLILLDRRNPHDEAVATCRHQLAGMKTGTDSLRVVVMADEPTRTGCVDELRVHLSLASRQR